MTMNTSDPGQAAALSTQGDLRNEDDNSDVAAGPAEGSSVQLAQDQAAMAAYEQQSGDGAGGGGSDADSGSGGSSGGTSVTTGLSPTDVKALTDLATAQYHLTAMGLSGMKAVHDVAKPSTAFGELNAISGLNNAGFGPLATQAAAKLGSPAFVAPPMPPGAGAPR